MEFFKIIDIQTTGEDIQQHITVDRLDEFCSNLFILREESEQITVGSIWGEFSFFSLKIKGGLRMGLLDCPNAVSWTITTGYPPTEDKVVLHLTINRTEKGAEFISEIQGFMEDWEVGMIKQFKSLLIE